MKTPTPHNSAKKGEIAKEVLMAGDPLRVKFISENFLEDAKLVSKVRGVPAYTGKYKGQEITVMAHGMGNPSMGIYSYELFNFYGVEKIIRVGTIGAMKPEISLGSIIISEKTYTNTNYLDFYSNNGAGFIEANKILLKQAQKIGKKLDFNIYSGVTLCSDTFYSDNKIASEIENQCLGVEMETAALYLNAEKAKKKALTICTVSDNVKTGESSSSEDREKRYVNMIKLALEVLLNV